MREPVEFNPKNLPVEKVGICKGDEHEGKRSGQNVRLSMRFIDDGLEDKFERGTEKYLCDECWEYECT